MEITSSFAARLYDAAGRLAPGDPRTDRASAPDAVPPAAEDPPGSSFAEAMAAVASEFAATLRAGEAAAREAMLGKGDVQSLVEALTAAELALETAVTVRDRVVEAYQEILRMPI